MKIRNIIASLLAVFCLAGCSETIKESLDEIQVSQSYVGLSQHGGNASIKVSATGSWSFDGIPGWLTVSPVSGGAGETTVTFSADASTSSNEAELFLTCGTAVQHINVIQMADKIDLPISTVAEINAGADGKVFKARGTCTAIANTSYGNWYLQDETGSLYIYGTVDASGSYNWASFNIEVGDIVTVEGPKTTYGTTVELVDASVISVEKSLIKVETEGPVVVEKDGGKFEVELTCKGNGVSVVLPESAKSWLSVNGISNSGQSAVVSFTAAANEAGDRSETLVFTTNGGQYTAEIVVTQKGSIVAASIAEFLSAEVGDTQYRLTGVITSVANASYGNVYIRDWSGEVYVYGIGARGDFETIGLKVGDVVTLVGKRAAYNGTAQVGGAQHEGHISVIEVSVEEFLSKEDNPNVYYMVTGTLDEIVNATYGNVYLADDKGNRVYSYGCYPGWGATGDARKDAVATLGLKVGDELTIIGPKSTYNGETQINGGIYFSHKSAE